MTFLSGDSRGKYVDFAADPSLGGEDGEEIEDSEKLQEVSQGSVAPRSSEVFRVEM